ncbi:LRR domain containing protein [Trema orientale]|uniref:LRR domain containing protein n=1 Tax=Trema orientale TaxID=63057 RepID=A0A2P5EBA1_TREOI|nr:LRR domain containing protein [Trema orientale]
MRGMPVLHLKKVSMIHRVACLLGLAKIAATGWVLDVATKQATGNIPEVAWGNLCSLQTLELSANDITGDIVKIMAALSECHNSSLSIFRKLVTFVDSGPIFQRVKWHYSRKYWPIDAVIGIKSLGEFMGRHHISNLSSNYIEGSIPPSIKELRNLISLDLSFNHFSGEIFERLTGLDKLQVLDLSNNNLFDGIPTSMCLRLRSIYWLKLSDNSLSGELPSSLQNCTNLIALDLGDNSISGAIPTRINAENLIYS